MRSRFAVAVPVFAVLSIASLPALAADLPKWTRVSVTDDAATTMTVSWNTTGNVGGEVQYGFTTQYGQTAQAPAAVQTAFGWLHSIVLTGLEPLRTYHYKVGSAADGWSQNFTFVTAPAGQCTPFDFVGLGDGRALSSGASPEWPNVFKTAYEDGAGFILYGGDWVYDGGEASQWNDFLNKSAAHLPLVPLMGIMGNHDDGPGEGDGANFNQIFVYPRNNSDNVEDYFSFNFGSVHVVGISTESFKANGYASQAAWLDADLAANDRIWTVMMLHRPFYSSGNHGSDDGGAAAALIPIIDKYHVDVVVGGHDHDYERFKPMKGGNEVSSYEQGTLHIVSGGAGAATDPIFPFRPKLPTSAKADNKNHYVLFSVDGPTMHVKAVRVPGGLQGGTGAIEEFDLSKTVNPDPCLAPPDAGTPDTGTPDAGVPDASTPDVGTPDTGAVSDTGVADTGPNPSDASDPSDVSNPSDVSTDAETDDGAVAADAGEPGDDAETTDATTTADATEGDTVAPKPDAGTPTDDTGMPSGDRDAGGGTDDTGTTTGEPETGCSCTQMRL